MSELGTFLIPFLCQALCHMLGVLGTTGQPPFSWIYPWWLVQRRNSCCWKFGVCRPILGASKAVTSLGRGAGAQGSWDLRGQGDGDFLWGGVRLGEDRVPKSRVSCRGEGTMDGDLLGASGWSTWVSSIPDTRWTLPSETGWGGD